MWRYLKSTCRINVVSFRRWNRLPVGKVSSQSDQTSRRRGRFVPLWRRTTDLHSCNWRDSEIASWDSSSVISAGNTVYAAVSAVDIIQYMSVSFDRQLYGFANRLSVCNVTTGTFLEIAPLQMLPLTARRDVWNTSLVAARRVQRRAVFPHLAACAQTTVARAVTDFAFPPATSALSMYSRGLTRCSHWPICRRTKSDRRVRPDKNFCRWRIGPINWR